MDAASVIKLAAADVERVVPFEQLIDRHAADRESAWVNCRRMLHAAPEPSGQETQTSQFILSRLNSMQIDARIPERGVGVIADLRLGNVSSSTPIIAVRADIDALRMPDQKDVPYASGNAGLAHACGHDVHTTVVLATAELLKTLADKLPAVQLPAMHIRFLFQAAEETCDGALWMIKDGALDNVAAVLGLHVDPMIEVGRIGIRYGVLTAQVDEVEIRIRGRGGHAARPQHTTDPVAAAAMLISNLYQSIPRHADALTPTVFTIGTIQGGTASNIIPDRVDITGTLRTTDAETRLRVISLIRTVCEANSQITGNRVEAHFFSPLGSVVNDPLVASVYEESARQVVGEAGIVRIDKPSMGGEDFAMYTDRIRGAQIRLGCAGDAAEWPLLHSPVFDIDERAVAIGARVIARAVMMLAMMPQT